jgi:hypothetical protein
MSSRSRAIRRPEQAIQKAVFQHIRQRGVPGLVAWHTPNGAFYGGKRSGKGVAIQGSIMAGLGVRAGVSDVILVLKGKIYAMELKAPGGRASEAQMKFLADIDAAGAYTAMPASLDAALATLETWGLLRGSSVKNIMQRTAEKIQSRAEKKNPRCRARADDWPEDFGDQFWQAYPRKTEKLAAMRKLASIRKSGIVTFTDLMAGVQSIRAAKTDPQFTKHPTTWLNAGCWADETQPGGTNGNRNHASPRGSASADFFAGMRSVAADIAGDGQHPGLPLRKYLSGGLTLTAEQRAPIAAKVASSRGVSNPTTRQDNRKARLGLVANMLMAYPMAGGSEESGRARAHGVSGRDRRRPALGDRRGHPALAPRRGRRQGFKLSVCAGAGRTALCAMQLCSRPSRQSRTSRRC